MLVTTGMNLRPALKAAWALGCTCENIRRTGEVAVFFPTGDRVVINSRRKDAPRELTTRLAQLSKMNNDNLLSPVSSPPIADENANQVGGFVSHPVSVGDGVPVVGRLVESAPSTGSVKDQVAAFRALRQGLLETFKARGDELLARKKSITDELAEIEVELRELQAELREMDPRPAPRQDIPRVITKRAITNEESVKAFEALKTTNYMTGSAIKQIAGINGRAATLLAAYVEEGRVEVTGRGPVMAYRRKA